MFTNKNKLIAFIALIVVVVLLASTGIALIADNANKKANEEAQARIDAANKAIEDATNKITELQGALDDLQSALNSSKSDLAAANQKIQEANAKIEELVGSKITIEDWDNATEAAYPAIQKVVAAHRNLLDNVHLYDVEDEEARAALVATSEKATDSVIVAILRARTTDAVEELVEDYFETVEELNRSRYDETLAGLIDKAKEDNGPIWGTDNDEVQAAVDYLGRFSEVDNPEVWEAFKNFGDRDLVAEVAQLEVDLYNSHVAQLKATFLACEIPETVVHESLEGGNFDKVVAARTAYDALVAVCVNGEEEAEDVQAHYGKLVEAEARVIVLTNAATAAEPINSQIDGFTFVLSVEKREELAAIKGLIEAWVSDYSIDEPNMGLVKKADYDVDQANFDAAVEELGELHDKLHTAINAIGEDVTINSGDKIEAAKSALNALVEKCGVDTDIEGLLNLDHTVQDDRDAIATKSDAFDHIVDDFSEIRALIVTIYNNTFVHADLDVNLADLATKINAYVDEDTDVAGVVALVDETKDEGDVNDYVGLYAKIQLFPAKKAAYDSLESIKTTYISGQGNEEIRDRIVKTYDRINEEILNANTAEGLAAINADYINAQFENAVNPPVEDTEK